MGKYLKYLFAAGKIIDFIVLLIKSLEDKQLSKEEIDALIEKGYDLMESLGYSAEEVQKMSAKIKS
jgi:uncharacterized membrane protein